MPNAKIRLVFNNLEKGQHEPKVAHYEQIAASVK